MNDIEYFIYLLFEIVGKAFLQQYLSKIDLSRIGIIEFSGFRINDRFLQLCFFKLLPGIEALLIGVCWFYELASVLDSTLPFNFATFCFCIWLTLIFLCALLVVIHQRHFVHGISNHF